MGKRLEGVVSDVGIGEGVCRLYIIIIIRSMGDFSLKGVTELEVSVYINSHSSLWSFFQMFLYCTVMSRFKALV